jgi:hypothetical protein
MTPPSDAKVLLHCLIDGALQEWTDDELDQRLLALKLEQGRRWQLRRRNPEVINP